MLICKHFLLLSPHSTYGHVMSFSSTEASHPRRRMAKRTSIKNRRREVSGYMEWKWMEIFTLQIFCKYFRLVRDNWLDLTTLWAGVNISLSIIPIAGHSSSQHVDEQAGCDDKIREKKSKSNHCLVKYRKGDQETEKGTNPCGAQEFKESNSFAGTQVHSLKKRIKNRKIKKKLILNRKKKKKKTCNGKTFICYV